MTSLQPSLPAVLLVLALGACDAPASGGGTTTAAPTSHVSATPQPVASTTAIAAPSAAPAEAPDFCHEHDLTLGGAGTQTEPCKYAEDVLKASYAGTVDDAGALIAIENPWPQEVTVLSAAVYYYDAAGKQLAIEVDGKETRSARSKDQPVKLAGKKSTTVPLGFAKKDLPETVDTVEVVIHGFGIDAGDGKTVHFASTAPFLAYRGIHGGDGPTGIGVCDQYRDLLESCPAQFSDALASMRKSIRGYNNAAPEIQAKLAEGLTKTCETALPTVQDRVTRALAENRCQRP